MHIAGDHHHVNGDRILFKDAVYVYRNNKWKVDRTPEATRMLGQNIHWVGQSEHTGTGGLPILPVSRFGHRQARLTTGQRGLLIGGDDMAEAVIMRSNGNFTLDKNGQLVPFKRDPKKGDLPRYFYAQSDSAKNQLNISREKADVILHKDFVKLKAGNLRTKQGLLNWNDDRIIKWYNTNLKRGWDPVTNESLKLILQDRGLSEDPNKPGAFLTKKELEIQSTKRSINSNASSNLPLSNLPSSNLPSSNESSNESSNIPDGTNLEDPTKAKAPLSFEQQLASNLKNVVGQRNFGERDRITSKLLAKEGYDTSGISRFDQSDFLRDLRIGHAWDTGKGTIIAPSNAGANRGMMQIIRKRKDKT